MSRAPDEVDALGNLNPHYQEGLRIPVRDADLNGTVIDISGLTLVFKTPTLTIPLIADPGNPTGKLLVITAAQVQGIPAAGQDFVVVNTDADPDDVRWEGRITPRGWL